MGFRRIRNITIIFLLFFSYSFSDMQVIIENDSSFWSKICENFISTFFSTSSALLLAYWGIRRERKKEEKNLRQEWYNKIILEKLIDLISEYYDFIDNNMLWLNGLNDGITNDLRKIRNKLRHKLDYLKLFDKELYLQCAKIIQDSMDNYSSDLGMIEKKQKNNSLKIEILKKIYNKSNNL